MTQPEPLTSAHPTVWQDGAFWVLTTAHSAYAFGVNPQGFLVHSHWGPRLPRPADYPRPPAAREWASSDLPRNLLREEYPAHGGPSFVEPCLKVTFADGTRDLDLRFEAAHVEDETLQVTLQDAVYPLAVHLHYRAHPETDLIERWARVENRGAEPVTLERVFSAQWHLPVLQDYHLTHLHGRWIDEFRATREALTAGVKVLESRRLVTSHHHQPYFALDRAAPGLDAGELWFGTLAWSGNWRTAVEVTAAGHTRLSQGLNDWDFAWTLGAGEIFETPASLAGYTTAGENGAAQRLHAHVQGLLPHAGQTRAVLYNSWEATLFDVDEASQAQLAETAAEIGVELFVVDDGWFHGRGLDNAGLGDWWPDEGKFPQGLTPLIERVRALGMDFGLWVEPEMVNPDSELYRAHPDWVIHFPSRPRTEARGQLILNLGREDVQDHLIEVLDRLLTENDISFIKWDMNRNVSEPGWPGAPREARELWVRYVQGLYRVWGTLRERHPAVIWQSCSSGGGRADYGILRYADQIWVSDNTSAPARLSIQEGYARLFPASTMEAWVTDADPTLPLEFRFHVSMTGLLGVGGHLGRWSETDLEVAREQIKLYKDIREVVQFGTQYRLRGSAEPYSALMFVSPDGGEGVLFAFRTHIARPGVLPPLYLRGLDPEALYEVEGEPEARSGAAWMHAGLQLDLRDFQSAVRRIRRR